MKTLLLIYTLTFGLNGQTGLEMEPNFTNYYIDLDTRLILNEALFINLQGLTTNTSFSVETFNLEHLTFSWGLFKDGIELGYSLQFFVASNGELFTNPANVNLYISFSNKGDY